jgi:hypothetical protein
VSQTSRSRMDMAAADAARTAALRDFQFRTLPKNLLATSGKKFPNGQFLPVNFCHQTAAGRFRAQSGLVVENTFLVNEIIS